MIHVRPSSKKDFLDIVGGQVDGRKTAKKIVDVGSWVPDTSEEFHLVWADAPTAPPPLPNLILIERSAQREFLAWTSTFLAAFKPFTAHFRVMDIATFRLVQGLGEQPRFRDVVSPALALIFAENFLAAESGASLSLPACRSTFSYAAGRHLAIGASPDSAEILTDGWARLQRTFHSPRSVPELDSLILVWRALESAAQGMQRRQSEREVPPSVLSACEEIAREGAISPGTWSRLCGIPKLADAIDQMSGPREQRVVYFEQASQQLRDVGSSSPTERAFACGYLASRVATGTLEHFGLVRPLLSSLPGVVYWYALCAGLQPQSEIPHQNRGLGFRLLRDLLAPDSWAAAPRADIAIAELEVLRSGDHHEEFWTSAPGVIEVEIAPLVSTIIRAPSTRGTAPQPDLFQGERREDPEAVRRLGDALEQAQFYFRRMAGHPPRGHHDRLDKRGRK